MRRGINGKLRDSAYAVCAVAVASLLGGCTSSASRSASGARPITSRSAATTSTSTSITSTTNTTNNNPVDSSRSVTSLTRPPRAPKPYDSFLRATIASVGAYWTATVPPVFGGQYKALSGGIYAYSQDSTIPRCGGFGTPYVLIQQNAFYCPESDFIAWDDQGLFPRLQSRYGTFLLSIVLAHEWGHAIQHREGVDFVDEVLLEGTCLPGPPLSARGGVERCCGWSRACRWTRSADR